MARRDFHISQRRIRQIALATAGGGMAFLGATGVLLSFVMNLGIVFMIPFLVSTGLACLFLAFVHVPKKLRDYRVRIDPERGVLSICAPHEKVDMPISAITSLVRKIDKNGLTRGLCVMSGTDRRSLRGMEDLDDLYAAVTALVESETTVVEIRPSRAMRWVESAELKVFVGCVAVFAFFAVVGLFWGWRALLGAATLTFIVAQGAFVVSLWRRKGTVSRKARIGVLAVYIFQTCLFLAFWVLANRWGIDVSKLR